MVLFVKGAGCIALESSAYHKVTDISKSSKCERSDIPGCCCSHAHAFFFFFFKVWDNSYFLSGFDWLSEEAVSYKLPSHSASALSLAEGQVSTEEEKFWRVLLNP